MKRSHHPTPAPVVRDQRRYSCIYLYLYYSFSDDFSFAGVIFQNENHISGSIFHLLLPIYPILPHPLCSDWLPFWSLPRGCHEGGQGHWRARHLSSTEKRCWKCTIHWPGCRFLLWACLIQHICLHLIRVSFPSVTHCQRVLMLESNPDNR